MVGRPDPPCPTVDVCSSTFSDCRLNVTKSGDLSCYVQGSRPRIDIDWIVTNQSGISFTNKEQVIRYHDETGTYLTTRTIHYTADGCGGKATLYCNASLSESSSRSILDSYNKTVQISSGIFANCYDKNDYAKQLENNDIYSTKYKISSCLLLLNFIIFLKNHEKYVTSYCTLS